MRRALAASTAGYLQSAGSGVARRVGSRSRVVLRVVCTPLVCRLSDLPMVVLSLIYVLNSVAECIKGARANQSLSNEPIVCDLPSDAKQLALILIGTISSAAMLTYKMGLCEQVRLQMTMKDGLKAQRSMLLAELEADVPSPGSQSSVSSAAAGSPQLSASAAAEGSQQQHGGFIVSRSVPPPPAPPALPNVQQLDAAEEGVVVRGVCDGCKQNVMSNDEGRKREDDKYYHEQCIKG